MNDKRRMIARDARPTLSGLFDDALNTDVAKETIDAVITDEINAGRLIDVQRFNGGIIDPAGRMVFAGVELTPTGLIFPDELAQPDADALLNILLQMDGSIAWMLGDMLAYQERRWGVTYQQIAEHTGRDISTLRDYNYVATNVKVSLRNDKLTWTHHKVVAPKNADAQQRWLNAAIENGWSAAELRREMAAFYRDPVDESADADAPIVSPAFREALDKLRTLTPRRLAKMKRAAEVKELMNEWERLAHESQAIYTALRDRLAELEGR